MVGNSIFCPKKTLLAFFLFLDIFLYVISDRLRNAKKKLRCKLFCHAFMRVFSSGLLFLLIHSLSGGRSVILFVKSEDLHQVLKSTLINLVLLSEITILGTPNHAKTAKRHFLTVRVVRSLVGKNSIQPLPASTATNIFRCF